MFEHFMQTIRRETERTLQKLVKKPRLGLVSSYDPVKHAVQVQYQPEGTTSGWIPLSCIAVGNQFGVAYAPNIKDQVEIHFEGGDQMSARVMTRHFSKFDVAPMLQAGEYAQIHGTGSVITHKADGTLLIGGAGTVPVGQIGGGTSGNTGTGQSAQAPPTQQQQPVTANAKQTITLKPDGTMIITVPNNDYNIVASKNVNTTVGENDTSTVSGNRTRTVSGDDTKTAANVTINSGGAVSVTAPKGFTINGNLTVTGMISGALASAMG